MAQNISCNCKRLISVVIALLMIFSFVGYYPFMQNTYAATTVTNNSKFYIEYVAKSKDPNKKVVVDVTDVSYENGKQLQVWELTPGNQNQIFRFEKYGDYWRIIAEHSGKVVEVRDMSKENYAQIAQWDGSKDKNYASQLWEIKYHSDGTVSFKNKNSGLYMDVFAYGYYKEDGSSLVQYKYSDSEAPKFRLMPIQNEDVTSALWVRKFYESEITWKMLPNIGTPAPNRNHTRLLHPSNPNMVPQYGTSYIVDIKYLNDEAVESLMATRALSDSEKAQISKAVKDYCIPEIIGHLGKAGGFAATLYGAGDLLVNIAQIRADDPDSWNNFVNKADSGYVHNKGYKPMVIVHYIDINQSHDYYNLNMQTSIVGQYYESVIEKDRYEFINLDSTNYENYISNYIKSKSITGGWKEHSYRNEYHEENVSYVTEKKFNAPYVIHNYDYRLGQYKVIVSSNSSLNVRSGAGQGHSKIGSLKRGDIVYVEALSGNWGRINYNGKTGWICLDYTSYEGNTQTNNSSGGGSSSVTNYSSWDTSSSGDYTVVVNSLNVRSYASTSKPVICQVNTGDIVHVIETTVKSDGSIWAHITYNGINAYCCMKTSGGKYYLSQKIAPSKPYVNATGGTSQSDSYFSWNWCSNAKSYDIRIYNSSGQVVDSKFGLTSTSYQTRLKAGNYSVDVASVYSGDSYTFSDRVNFTVNKVTPDKPVVNVSPGNDLSDTCISWNSCRYADCYDMVIYKSNGSEYKRVSNTTGTYFKGNLSDIADYYVIVTAKNKTDGTSNASDRKNFTVVSAVPSKPTLSIIPGNNYTNTTFTWNVCENANTYTLDVVNTDTGEKVLSKSLTGTTYEMILSTAGNYVAQVTSVYTKGGTTNPSEKVKFYVESVDVTEFTVSVAGVSDSMVSLEWTESLHATQYDIYRYSEGKYTLVGTTAERAYVDTGLYIGTAYKYYVKSSNQWTNIDSNEVSAETILLYINGSGTKESPYLISDEDDYLEFAELINNKLTNRMFANAYYKQTIDLDFSDMQIVPIGTESTPFVGTYDGNYCSISGVNINTSSDYAGLFGYCKDAAIENVVVHGKISSSKNNVGGIAGQIGLGGKIENCAFYGDISGAYTVGGIVGNIENGGTLTRCYHMGNVKGTNSGGIAGQIRVGKSKDSSNANLSSCYHAGGNISGTNNGGITGIEDKGTIKSCSIKYVDCFYLKDSSTSAANGTTNNGILSASDTVFQNLVETLGAPYTDGGVSNNHYPVFAWEAELHDFQGHGTNSSPYLIEDSEDLNILSEYVNDKYLNSKYGNACYMQIADIDLKGSSFTPIGSKTSPFNGSYNGGYHSISGLSVNATESGLFGYVENIKLENLIVNGTISSTDSAGGLIGYSENYAYISQCAFNGDIKGKTSGGLIGTVINSANIFSCYHNGKVDGTDAGGLIGKFKCEDDAPLDSIVITSSYHGNGNISGDGAIGTVSGNKSAISTENVYYLKNTATSSSFAKSVNETVLKDLAITLEKPYSHGTINNGYPVFEWQISRYQFSGNGTEESPYIIASADDLIALQTYVNDPSYNQIYGNAYYIQTVDIDLGDREWDAIGINEQCAFNGVYDGQFCTVYGLNAYGDKYSGLFGQVGATSGGRNAGIYNLIIKYGTSCSASGVTGGTAAILMNGANVDCCSVIGDLTGGSGVGGLVGVVRKSASITNSYHNGNLSGNSKVGGIVGYVESGTAKIENCYHTSGLIYATENSGAIVGYSKGTANIINCFYLNGTCEGAINGHDSSGTLSVNSMVLQNLSVTLGSAYIDNFTNYNDGYPIFAKQFEIDRPIVKGDANADGSFDISDLVMLQNWLLTAGDLTDWQAADLCEDGRIDVFDLVMMKRLYLGIL